MRTREAPLLTCIGAFARFGHSKEASLVCVVELIMAEAAAARKSRAVRIERVVAALLRHVTLREHRARGER
jgi:hypothetical protein